MRADTRTAICGPVMRNKISFNEPNNSELPETRRSRSRSGTRRLSGLFLVCLLAITGTIPACGEMITLKASQCDAPGRRVPDGEIPTHADVALDVFCAKVIADRSAPNGYVTIFGSARAKEGMRSYDQTREFARLWTKQYGERHPILTGGGPGIMDAGNRGAKEAGGPSLGFSTYFGEGNEPLNPYTTDGYVFASFAQREADMIDRAVALLAAPGGVGTEWEIYESLAKIQTNKKKPAPIILLGAPSDWNSLFARLENMVKRGTVSPEDPTLLRLATTPEDAVRMIAEDLYGAEEKVEQAASR